MPYQDVVKRFVVAVAAAQLLVSVQFATVAQAEMISTDLAISGHVSDTGRAALLDELQRQDIRAELVRQGVNPVEAEARLAALTDDEIQKTLSQMEDGSAGAGIVGTLGTIFIILLVTDLLCFTHLFNFTRCVR